MWLCGPVTPEIYSTVAIAWTISSLMIPLSNSWTSRKCKCACLIQCNPRMKYWTPNLLMLVMFQSSHDHNITGQHIPCTLAFRSFLVMLTKSTGFLSTTCGWYFIRHFQSKITTLDFFLYKDIKLCKWLKQLFSETIHLLSRVTLRLFFNRYHVSCIWWIQCIHVVTWFTRFTCDTKERL